MGIKQKLRTQKDGIRIQFEKMKANQGLCPPGQGSMETKVVEIRKSQTDFELYFQSVIRDPRIFESSTTLSEMRGRFVGFVKVRRVAEGWGQGRAGIGT